MRFKRWISSINKISPSSNATNKPLISRGRSRAGAAVILHFTPISADKINAILDALDWPTDSRDLDTGRARLAAETIADNTNAATYLQKVEASDPGALFVAKDGSLTFRDRAALQDYTDGIAFGTDLVAPLRSRLERAVSDGGGDNDDVARRVRAVYREWKTQHIDVQLDDLLRAAHGGGLVAALEPGTPVITDQRVGEWQLLVGGATIL